MMAEESTRVAAFFMRFAFTIRPKKQK